MVMLGWPRRSRVHRSCLDAILEMTLFEKKVMWWWCPGCIGWWYGDRKFIVHWILCGVWCFVWFVCGIPGFLLSSFLGLKYYSDLWRLATVWWWKSWWTDGHCLLFHRHARELLPCPISLPSQNCFIIRISLSHITVPHPIFTLLVVPSLQWYRGRASLLKKDILVSFKLSSYETTLIPPKQKNITVWQYDTGHKCV